MKLINFFLFMVILLCSCQPTEKPINQKSIFAVNNDEFKSFKGKTVHDFLSAYQDNFSYFMLLRGEDNKFYGAYFRYDNTSGGNSNIDCIYIYITMHNMQYQDSTVKENEGDSKNIQEEVISEISSLVLPRNEFEESDSTKGMNE